MRNITDVCEQAKFCSNRTFANKRSCNRQICRLAQNDLGGGPGVVCIQNLTFTPPLTLLKRVQQMHAVVQETFFWRDHVSYD